MTHLLLGCDVKLCSSQERPLLFWPWSAARSCAFFENPPPLSVTGNDRKGYAEYQPEDSIYFAELGVARMRLNNEQRRFASPDDNSLTVQKW